MRLAPYSEYLACEHPWLVKLPSAWNLKRIKHIADSRPSNVDKKSKDNETPVLLCNYTDVYYNEIIDSSLEYMKATATKDQIKRFALDVGDVVMTKDSEDPNDIGIPTLITEKVPDLICGYHLALIRPTKCFGPFLKRIFDSDYLRKVFATTANGLTRYGLGSYAINNALVPLPPREEQKAIATFLDRETARIDTLIEKQQRLIALLKEKRQAVISHAVTKGLDPTVPMKDSGVEWLGEVPEHWDISRLKYETSNSVDCLHSTPDYKDGEQYPAIRTADISPGNLDLKNARRVSEATFFERNIRLTPRARDIVYSREGERFGMAALIPRDAQVCLGQRVMLFRVTQNAEYVMWVLNSDATYKQASQDVIGATSPHVNVETIKNFTFALPSAMEQLEIVDHLVMVIGKLDRTAEKAAEKNELLQERRTALISAAVTGKIDVRHHPSAQPALSEVASQAASGPASLVDTGTQGV